MDHAERNTESAGRWNALGPHPPDPAGRHDLRPLLALARGSGPRSAALMSRRGLLPGGLGCLQKRQISENRIQPALIKIYRPPGERSLRWTVFLCLWLVMWSTRKCQDSNAQKCAGIKAKAGLFRRKGRLLWSCYPDLNRRPHPYQEPNTIFSNHF